MSFATNFAIEFPSFRIDSEPNKYLFNTSNPFLLIQHNKASRLEIKNEDEEDIENPGSRFFLSKKDL